MRLMLAMMTASAALMSTGVHSHDLLVGTYTDGGSEGLYRYRFDSATGQIDSRPLQVIPTSNPSWLTVSADRRQVFVTNEQVPGEVSAFTLEQLNRLSPLNQVPSGGGQPTYSSLSHDSRYLFVANYGGSTPGGSLNVLPVSVGGELGEPVQQLQHTPSRVDSERQSMGHVHSVVSSPDGLNVFAADLGADQVFRYRYASNSVSQPLSLVDSLRLPPGSGPRHLLFGGAGEYAWLTLEMSGEVAVLDYRDGNLTVEQIVPLSATGAAGDKAAGALHASADGRFLYVSNRGSANELVVYAIDPHSGRLEFVQRRAVEGDHPREFTFDPEEKFVLIGNQKSNQIVVMRRDPQSGMIGDTVQVFSQPSPSDLKFID